MGFELFRRQVKAEVFDFQTIENYFKEIRKPRDKASALVNEGKIIRLKNGLYAFGENWRQSSVSLEMLANLLYGPSCVSFEYALTRYGLIAERASTITSLVIGDNKEFSTPLGTFEYQAIDRALFKVGINYVNLGAEGGYFIASKEKALIDLVYRCPGIRTIEQLRYFLFEEMRVDEEIFRDLDFQKLEEIADVYNKKSVKLIGRL